MYRNFRENKLLSVCPVRKFDKPVLCVKNRGFKVINDLLLKVFF